MVPGFWWEKPEIKRLLRRPSCRWEDDIKMILKGIKWECTDCRIEKVAGCFAHGNIHFASTK
jgi:hypothetical protein